MNYLQTLIISGLMWVILSNEPTPIQIGGYESDDEDYNDLIHASNKGDLKIVKKLIKEHAGVNIVKGAISPLIIASFSGHLEIVKELLKAGADVNKGNYKNQSALMMAIFGGRLEIIKELIKAGANVNHVDRDDTSSLLIASKLGHLEIVKELIKAGADVNKGNIYDMTTLETASLGGHLEIVKELIKAGAIINFNINKMQNKIRKYLNSQLNIRQRTPSNPSPNKCHEDINIISQQKWEDEDLTDLIYIKWSNKRTDCYKADELRDYIASAETMIEWKGKEDNNTGHGWSPNLEKITREYISLYPLRKWVLIESIIMVLNSNKREFKAVKIGKGRLGNKQGTFGVSQKHAQEEENLWKLIEI